MDETNKTRDEDTHLGRKTYFGNVELLHIDVPGDPTSIILMRNEEMRYGVELTRGTWPTFFSAKELLIIAEFVQQHRAWLEWGNSQNNGDLLAPNPGGYIARPDNREDEELGIYVLFSPIQKFHTEPNDPTGIILVRNDAGYYGTCIVGNIVFPPTFYLSGDMLKIAEFATKHQPWVEQGASRNAEQSANAVTRDEYVSLYYNASSNPGAEEDISDRKTVTLLLYTCDEYAIYGIPAHEQEQTGPFCWRPYPHHSWKKIVSSKQE